jgi:hypothetical protein
VADQIMAADKSRLKDLLGTLSREDMTAVEHAIKVIWRCRFECPRPHVTSAAKRIRTQKDRREAGLFESIRAGGKAQPSFGSST